MKVYLAQYGTELGCANCLPYVFKTEEEAQQYIDEATYFPREFHVIEFEL